MNKNMSRPRAGTSVSTLLYTFLRSLLGQKHQAQKQTFTERLLVVFEGGSVDLELEEEKN